MICVFNTEVKRRILDFLRENDRPRSTGEIAEHVGISVDSARYHLMRMHLDGEVELIKVTKRVWLWRAKEDKQKSDEHKS